MPNKARMKKQSVQISVRSVRSRKALSLGYRTGRSAESTKIKRK